MFKNILNKLLIYFEIMRPKQWAKNIVVFIPVFFNGSILQRYYFLSTLYLFFVMCLLSSSVYVLNDILDKKHDMSHPTKKKRPLPSGRISLPEAIILAVLLFCSSLLVNFLLLKSEYIIVLQVLYFVMMVLYSVWLKNISIVDTIVISIGFMIRVFSGAILLQIIVPAMLAITLIGGALLISFGKRRSEISIMNHDDAIKYRPTLGKLPVVVLDNIIASLVAVTFMSYILFCYESRVVSFNISVVELLPPLLKNSQMLMLTIPVAFYTIARYMVLIYNGEIADKPEDLWWQDKQMLLSLMLWGGSVFALIYSFV